MSAFEWDKPTAEQLAARKRWVELLRSGKYEQLKGYLATEDGTKRCCLGVACDPVVTGIDLKWETYPTHTAGKVRNYEEVDNATLPRRVQAALGIDGDLPVVWSHDGTRGLSSLNDTGTPFPEIADLIEATYITPHEQPHRTTDDVHADGLLAGIGDYA